VTDTDLKRFFERVENVDADVDANKLGEIERLIAELSVLAVVLAADPFTSAEDVDDVRAFLADLEDRAADAIRVLN
jgi:hypothetical protein